MPVKADCNTDALRWKLGQLSPGSTVQFRRISWEAAQTLNGQCEGWLNSIYEMTVGNLETSNLPSFPSAIIDEPITGPILHTIHPSEGSSKPKIVFRQVRSELYFTFHLTSYEGR